MEKTHIWRTYEPRALQRSESWGPLNLEDNSSVPIWEVACATSAAPRYFNSIMIKGHEHVDGGVDANNPSLHTLKEIHYHHQNHVPELFVSIGTGRKHDDAKPSTIGPRISFEEMRIFTKKMKERMSAIGTLISIGRHGVRELTEKERSNKNWRDHCNALKLERRYRLDIGGSLSKIPLDEWLPRKSGEETLDKMKSEITQFLGQADTREQIESIAQRLVEIRRQRAETERWEVFAMNLEYACPGKNCQKQRPYSTRNGLRQHLLEFSVHPEMRDLRRVELERCLDQARRGVKDGQLKYAGTMSRKFTGDDP